VLPPEILLTAYASGYFPMAVETGDIGWFSPDPRGVVPLDGFHAPRRLRRLVRQGRFEIRVDTAFAEVMAGCADREDGSWINDEILESYTELHRVGGAHSVEAWREGRLAGGLYGVALGGAFFGESMFHRETDASKVALVALVDRLVSRGYRLLDVQWMTPHLASFGAVEISRRTYLRRLRAALEVPCAFD
jgi:leucyl/phenylalanyl-tRNA--protein transferase